VVKVPRGNQLVRLLTMFLTIQRNPGLTAKQLAERHKISERSCFRDLRVLQEAGIPIYNDRGYRVVDSFKLKNITLNLEEALSLIYGINLVEKQKSIFPSSLAIKEKLMLLLPERLQEIITGLEKRINIEVTPSADYSGKEELFRQLNHAISGQWSLQITYYSFSSDKTTERLVDPYHLSFRDGFWYLAAYCHRRQEVRLFRLDRIQKIIITEKKFIAPVEFDFDSYLGAAWQMERGEEFLFRVRFTGDSARYVQETVFHPSQKLYVEEGQVIFEARACGLASIVRWVLSFGSEAEVLEPKELRESIVREMRTGLKKYEK
jgi:predicted DNA-binding transcriptional regulator YafY